MLSVSFALVDRVGRRPLMLTALVLMTVAAAAMALALAVFREQRAPVAIAAILVFVGAFEVRAVAVASRSTRNCAALQMGPGPLFWLIAVEAFPNTVRSPALSTANALNWFSNIVVRCERLRFLPSTS